MKAHAVPALTLVLLPLNAAIRNASWMVLLVFAPDSVADVGNENGISFTNFGQTIILRQIEEQESGKPGDIQFYRVQGADIPGAEQSVAVSNRLVVKTAAVVSKAQLQSYHRQINKVTELYTGARSTYYSVEIEDRQALGTVLVALEAKRNIELVQPDILQVGERSERLASTAGTSLYLSLLNVPSLWRETKGKGIKVAIIDDGISLQHPDLQHIEPVFTYDSERRQLSSSPHSTLDGHGTKVAGIIFAAHNQIGIDGIAPEADLIALRQPDTWTSNTLISFQLAKLAGADIINCSWHSNLLLQPVAEVVEELATTGRGGNGVAVVFSAGNTGREIGLNETEASISGAVVIGAADKIGQPLSFSNYGSFVDLFVYGQHSISTAREGGYTKFAGTSLAAAITSGYIALLLAQDSGLSLEEIIEKMQKN